MTERIEPSTILEVTDNEGAIHLLINMKPTVMVEDPGYPIQNTPHPTSLVLCETIIKHSQYNTGAATYHYF